jgi:hypothetical protein
MSTEAIFNLRVNTGNSIEDINDFDKSVDNLNKSVKDVDKTFEQVYGDLKPLTTRLGEAEDRMYELALAGKQTSKEYQELLKTVANYRRVQLDTDAVVDASAERFSTKVVKAIEVTGATFTGLQSAIALTGVENEDLVKTMIKLQAVQGVVNSVNVVANAINENATLKLKARIALEKAKNFILTGSIASTSAMAVAEGGLTVATNTTSLAMKTLRGALIATGIGAIIVLIGTLIANFDKVTSVVQKFSGYVLKAYDYFDNLGVAVKVLIGIFFPFIGVVYGAIKALEYFNVIDNKTERDQKARHEANMKRVDKSLAKQAEQRKAKEDAYNAEDKSLGRQIALLEAQGKSSDALVEKRLKNSIKFQKELLKELELNERILKATNAMGVNDELIAETKKSIQETKDAILDAENQLDINKANIDKERLDNAKKANEDRLKAEQDYNKKLTEYFDAIEVERQSKITDAKEKELQALDNKYQELYAKADQAGQSDKDLIAKQQLEIAEINEKYAKIESDAVLNQKNEINRLKKEAEEEYLNQLEIISEENRRRLLTAQENEIQDVRDKYFTLEEQAKGNAEQLAILETAKLNEINDINLEYGKEKVANDKAIAEEQKKIDAEKTLQIIKNIERVIEVAQGVQNTFTAFNNLQNVQDNERLKKVKGNTAEEEKIKRAMFEREKKMKLAQVAIDTASAIVKAVSASPTTFGLPFSAFALATGIANAQAIRATTFDSGATPSSGGGAPSTGASASSFTQQSNQTTETNLTGLNLPNPTTTKVVVLESDITKIQNRVRVQEATSSY